MHSYFFLCIFPFFFKCYLIKLKPCLETDTKIPWYYSASGQCREHFFQPKIILILENQTGTDLGNDLRYLCTMTSFLSQVFFYMCGIILRLWERIEQEVLKTTFWNIDSIWFRKYDPICEPFHSICAHSGLKK